MHRICGPYRGYFIAVYTAHTRDGYVGYGQACSAQPDSLWRAMGEGDLVSAAYRLEQHALTAAEYKIRTEVDQMPPNWDPFTAPGELG